MIFFECSACAKRLKVKPELIGKKVQCPQCGQRVLVPTETAASVAKSAAGPDLSDETTRAADGFAHGPERSHPTSRDFLGRADRTKRGNEATGRMGCESARC